MANIKFSSFTTETNPANVDFLVGYEGTTMKKIDPTNIGGGATSLNGLSDCIDVCQEYECHQGGIIYDNCDTRQEIAYNGSGSADIMMHISDSANGLQSTLFSDMKFEIANYCHPPQHQPCYGQNGLSLTYVSMVQKLLGIMRLILWDKNVI